MNRSTYFITGATGTQGGQVARRLLALGHGVRALTRDPGTPAARALAAAGAELVHGSFTEPASVEAAARGTAAAFVMSTPFVAGDEAETREGLAAVAAVRRAGVPHLVYTSVANADRNTGIPHFDSKLHVEQAVREADGTWSVIAPVFFMANLTSPWWLPGLQQGAWSMALPAGRTLQMVANEDLGHLTTLALTEPARFHGRRIDVASDELSPAAAVEVLRRVTGRELAYTEQPLEQVMAYDRDFGLMLQWFDRVGYSADIAGLRREYPEVAWSSFEDWARRQDWEGLLAAPAARG